MGGDILLVVLICWPGIHAASMNPGCGYTEWVDDYITAGMDARLRFYQNQSFLTGQAISPRDYRWIRIANNQQDILLDSDSAGATNARYTEEDYVLTIRDVTQADEGAYVVECWSMTRYDVYFRTPEVTLRLREPTTTTANQIRATEAGTGRTVTGGKYSGESNQNTIIAILGGAVFIAMVSVVAIIITRRRAQKQKTDTEPFVQPSIKESDDSVEQPGNSEEASEHIIDDYAEIGYVQTGLKININKNSRRYKQCEVARIFQDEDADVLSKSTLNEVEAKDCDADKTLQKENDYASIHDSARGGACSNRPNVTSTDGLIGPVDGNEYTCVSPLSTRGKAGTNAVADSHSPGSVLNESIFGPIDGNEYTKVIPKSAREVNIQTGGFMGDSNTAVLNTHIVGPIDGNEYAKAMPKHKREGDINRAGRDTDTQGIGMDMPGVDPTVKMSAVGPIDGNEYATAIPKSKRDKSSSKDGNSRHQLSVGVEYANTETKQPSKELTYIELDQEWLRRSRDSLDGLEENLSQDDAKFDTAQPMEYVSIDFDKKAFVAPKRAPPSFRKPTASLKELKRK